MTTGLDLTGWVSFSYRNQFCWSLGHSVLCILLVHITPPWPEAKLCISVLNWFMATADELMSFVKCDTRELSYQCETMWMFLHIILTGKLCFWNKNETCHSVLFAGIMWSSGIMDQTHCGETWGLERCPSDLTSGNLGEDTWWILPVKLKLWASFQWKGFFFICKLFKCS